MKPTQEQILSALNEMIQSKTELKAEKVELGISQDVSKAVGEALKLDKETDSMVKDAKKTAVSLEKLFSNVDVIEKSYLDIRKQSSTIGKQLGKYFDILYKGAKELGVDIKDLPAYKEYVEGGKKLNKIYDDAQKGWEQVSKFKK